MEYEKDNAFMALVRELYFIFDRHLPKTEVFFNVFKENQGCIVVAESNRFSPGTKHIAIKYYHFQSFV